jgi:NADP-dependent 3-hydroxy acid dehydrogenase YdfG
MTLPPLSDRNLTVEPPVTGASNGMGLSVTEYLLAEGHSVIAAVRKPESMAAHKEKYGGKILVVKVNVQSQEEVDAAFCSSEGGVWPDRCGV